jgi:hypothetical protein
MSKDGVLQLLKHLCLHRQRMPRLRVVPSRHCPRNPQILDTGNSVKHSSYSISKSY